MMYELGQDHCQQPQEPHHTTPQGRSPQNHSKAIILVYELGDSTRQSLGS
jgi:hypothetical protein